MVRTRETTPITRDDLRAFVTECRETGGRMDRDPSHLIGALEQSHAIARMYDHVDSLADEAYNFLTDVEQCGYDVSYSPYGRTIDVIPLDEDGTPFNWETNGISVSVLPDGREQSAFTHTGETPTDILEWFRSPHRYTICHIGDSLSFDRAVAMWLIYQADQMRPGLLDQITHLDVGN